MRHSITGKKIALIVGALCLMLGLIQAAPAHQEQQKENSEAVSATKLSLTAFTYQGQLKDASGPVNGSYDFQFTLYSTQAGGEPASAREMKDVLLLNGLFNFRLDFGRAAFEAKESWLEIGVRPAGSGDAYAVLFPRQKLTPTPYAIFAQQEQWTLIGVPVGFADRALIKPPTNTDGTTPPNKETVAAAGTANFIAKFDDAGNATVNSLLFDNGTNVGIGTTMPNHRLRLSGGPAWTSNSWGGALELENGSAIGWRANAAGQRFGIGHTGAGTFFFRTASDPGTATAPSNYDLVISDAGNVGLGMGVFNASLFPNHRLRIVGGPAWTSNGWSGAMELDNAAAIAWRANAAGQRFGIGHTGGGLYFFHTTSDPGTNSSPANYDLVINDSGTVSVNVLQINGADFSENFDVRASKAPDSNASQAEIEPGMIVSIDLENPGKLVVSHHAYDRRVAGIISGAGGIKTGIKMGQAGSVADGAHPVALSGRVYCWADASNGPIEPGDLLTTSDMPGHAMKVRNHKKANGAIIGKAMTGLKSGQGLVLVLVTLQ